MKKFLLKRLLVVGLCSAAGIVKANIIGDALNTAGNAVKGSVNTATGVVTDVAEGDVVDMPANTVKRAVNTAGGAVSDTGRTVTNVFDGNENPVENESFRYTDEGPLLQTSGSYYDDVE